MKLIARDSEVAQLASYAASNQSEFIALYGRRRVGKTFLIRKHFQDRFAFFVTGVIDGRKEEQMQAFCQALNTFGFSGKRPKTWMEAFHQLAQLLERKAKVSRGRIVVFIDELPCFDTQNSGFVRALGHFWNTMGVAMSRLLLIVCGSATSWMIQKVVNNHGGLHNRITHTMHLKPFTLHQTEQFVKAQRCRWDRMSILQAYMALGGIPYYLSKLDFEQGVPDNIDRLFFAEDAELQGEYHRLFQSLYRNPEGYMEIVKLLTRSKKGLTRKQISETLSLANNGHLSRMLDDLVHCDFVRVFANGLKRNQHIYQLIDFFVLFHHQFVERHKTDPHYWRNHLGTPLLNSWYGLAFERVCLCHVRQIIQALRLDAMHTEYYSWRSADSDPGAQIDLIIDRADGIITICEIKYSRTEYSITRDEYHHILNRIECYSRESKCRKGIQTIIITTVGLKAHGFAEISPKFVTLNDLFRPLNN